MEGEIVSKEGVYVSAEIGVNWLGKWNILEQMVDESAYAGADAVKLQMFCSEEVKGHPAYDLLKKMVLSAYDVETICERAHKKNIDVVVTPMNPSAVDMLKDTKIDGVKIRAKDWLRTDIVEPAMALGKPTYISVPYENGVINKPAEVSDEDFRRGYMRTRARNTYHVMCIPKYPPKLEDLTLYVSSQVDGYSNHYPDWTIPLMAGYGKMAHDAARPSSVRRRFYLEVHVMADITPPPGPLDRDVSIYFSDLKKLVDALNKGEKAVG
ncbi:MAG: N-acetylneuraminate synthase family protein [Dehalococcoidales bacterium]|nr:N-acetylneuraminate synthase family protein [Dehalococcoidales bacterium]